MKNQIKAFPAALPILAEIARRLCHEHHVPLVFFKHQNTIAAVNDAGLFDLEKNPEAIFGKDHPFLQQVAEDFKTLCRHPNAGDLVISGWKPEGGPLSFNIENGAHGGPGREETRGVVLLPPVMGSNASFMRPWRFKGADPKVYRQSGLCRLQG